MPDMIKIAVDAMGGDNSPKKILDGIIHQHNKNKDIFYKIFGNKKEIDHLVDYFDQFYSNLSKKTLNSYLKSVSNP